MRGARSAASEGHARTRADRRSTGASRTRSQASAPPAATSTWRSPPGEPGRQLQRLRLEPEPRLGQRGHVAGRGTTFSQVPVVAGLPLHDREWIAAAGATTALLTYHDITTDNL